MDENNSLKFPDIGRTDSGFESARNSINPSLTDSVRDNSIASNFSSVSHFSSGLSLDDRSKLGHENKISIDDGISSLEQRTSYISLDNADPNFDKVYTYWMVADEHGNIPFHTAIAQQKFDTVHAILARCRYKYLLDIPNGAGLTPLVIAVMTDRADMARALVMYGADVTKLCHGNTALHLACERGDSIMVDMLTKSVDTDFLSNNSSLKPLQFDHSYINETNHDGMTALHLAVKAGHRHIVKILVKELGCNVNDRDERNGDTCLNILMKNGGDINVLRYLLQNDADPNIVNYAGHTALHLAAAYNLHEVVHILLNFTTADLAAMTPEEDYALDLACLDSSLAKCIMLEMDHRIPSWR